MRVKLVRQLAVDDLKVVYRHLQDGRHVSLAASHVGQQHAQLVAAVLDSLSVIVR